MFRFEAEDIDELFKKDYYFATEFVVVEVDDEYDDAYFSIVCNHCGAEDNYHYMHAKNGNMSTPCENCGRFHRIYPEAFLQFLEAASEVIDAPIKLDPDASVSSNPR